MLIPAKPNNTNPTIHHEQKKKNEANNERRRTAHGIFLAKCHDLNTISCVASSNLEPEIGMTLRSVHVVGV